MVKSEQIKTNYTLLLELVRNEAENNQSIYEYFNYLNEYRDKFIGLSNISLSEELKEFLRGANRYSDEFCFSDENYFQIRNVTNQLYDILNNDSPM